MKAFAVLATSALALSLAACGGQSSQDTAPAGTGVLSNFELAAHRGAALAISGDSIVVTRERGGEQGVTLRRAAVLVRFTVEGEGAMMRANVGGVVGDLPLAAENAVMIGPGGASAVTVYSTTGDQITVNVVSVTDCGGTPEGTCVAPAITPAAAPAAAPRAQAPAAAPRPPAPAPAAAPATDEAP